MTLSQLHQQAQDAARRHERLTRRVECEAGTAGITRLRLLLAQAAQRRIATENALFAAQGALTE